MLRSHHLKVCLSTSLLWNRSPNPWQDGILIPFFPSFSFLINSMEPPGAAGCRGANRSHFRPVWALKGAGCDECVLGVQSHPSPATCGWRHGGHLSQNLLGRCHPAHPNSHLQCWLWMPGWHEEREGRDVRGGGGGGGVTELETVLSRSCRLPFLQLLNRGSVHVVELNQVDLGNQVYEEEEVGRMRKWQRGTEKGEGEDAGHTRSN